MDDQSKASMSHLGEQQSPKLDCGSPSCAELSLETRRVRRMCPFCKNHGMQVFKAKHHCLNAQCSCTRCCQVRHNNERQRIKMKEWLRSKGSGTASSAAVSSIAEVQDIISSLCSPVMTTSSAVSDVDGQEVATEMASPCAVSPVSDEIVLSEFDRETLACCEQKLSWDDGQGGTSPIGTGKQYVDRVSGIKRMCPFCKIHGISAFKRKHKCPNAGCSCKACKCVRINNEKQRAKMKDWLGKRTVTHEEITQIASSSSSSPQEIPQNEVQEDPDSYEEIVIKTEPAECCIENGCCISSSYDSQGLAPSTSCCASSCSDTVSIISQSLDSTQPMSIPQSNQLLLTPANQRFRFDLSYNRHAPAPIKQALPNTLPDIRPTINSHPINLSSNISAVVARLQQDYALSQNPSSSKNVGPAEDSSSRTMWYPCPICLEPRSLIKSSACQLCTVEGLTKNCSSCNQPRCHIFQEACTFCLTQLARAYLKQQVNVTTS